jgi:hypothetical protein
MADEIWRVTWSSATDGRKAHAVVDWTTLRGVCGLRYESSQVEICPTACQCARCRRVLAAWERRGRHVEEGCGGA